MPNSMYTWPMSVATMAHLMASAHSLDDGPIRQTFSGKLQGYLHTEGSTTAEVHLGIPYGRSPVGALRFESPRPVDAWAHVRRTTESPPYCVQFWFENAKVDNRRQSEDCLYLNAFIPYEGEHSTKLYPVLYWIHGGSYQVNGVNMFPVEGTVRTLTSRGIAVVFVNYRLGLFGFLATMSTALPGNYGLEDQIAGLAWIRRNGASLRLDATRITVGGESAGAASASILAVSPASQHLFQQIILRSGSSLAKWAVRSHNTNLNSDLVVHWLHCDKHLPHNAKVKQCLQALSVGELLSAWREVGLSDVKYINNNAKTAPLHFNHPFLAHTYFTPVIDAFRGANQSIVPNYPKMMLAGDGAGDRFDTSYGPSMPAMVGVTTGECLAYVVYLHYAEQRYQVDLTNLEYVVPGVIYRNEEQIKDAVFDKYINRNSRWNNGNLDYAKALVKIVSDQNFVTWAVEEARQYAKAGQPVYTYVFEHTNSCLRRNVMMQYKLHDAGTPHGYDMVFMFQNSTVMEIGECAHMELSNDDVFVSELVASSVATFVKHGKPSLNDSASDPYTRSGVDWPRYEPSECGKAMFITTRLALADFMSDVHTFWTKTVPAIDSLTLTPGYKFHRPIDCKDGGTSCTQLHYYRFAFFVACGALVLLVVTMLLMCMVHKMVRAGHNEHGGTGHMRATDVTYELAPAKKRRAAKIGATLVAVRDEQAGKPLQHDDETQRPVAVDGAAARVKRCNCTCGSAPAAVRATKYTPLGSPPKAAGGNGEPAVHANNARGQMDKVQRAVPVDVRASSVPAACDGVMVKSVRV